MLKGKSKHIPLPTTEEFDKRFVPCNNDRKMSHDEHSSKDDRPTRQRATRSEQKQTYSNSSGPSVVSTVVEYSTRNSSASRPTISALCAPPPPLPLTMCVTRRRVCAVQLLNPRRQVSDTSDIHGLEQFHVRFVWVKQSKNLKNMS